MSRFKPLKPKEWQEMLDSWTYNEDDSSSSGSRARAGRKIDKFVVCPPSTFDEITDTEDFDDQQLSNLEDVNAVPEVAGNIEIEYESGVDAHDREDEPIAHIRRYDKTVKIEVNIEIPHV